MRKVLSFVLILALVLSSFSMAFAASGTELPELSDISGSPNEEAIGVSYDLGIITGNPDGTFQPEKAVTRAEFAAMITRALAIPQSALAAYSTTSFKDTSGYSWAVPYLAFCNSKGIMLGDGAGNAMPGKTINVNEAVTMSLRATGYTANSAELTGVWPSNYVTKAQELELYDDVAKDALGVDKANAAQIIYNLLSVQKVAVNSDGETKKLWDVEPNVNRNIDGVPTTLLSSGLNCTTEGKQVVTRGDGDESLINMTKHIGKYGSIYRNSDDEAVAFIDDSDVLVGRFFKDGSNVYKFKTTDGEQEYSINNSANTTISSVLVNGDVASQNKGIATTTIGGEIDPATQKITEFAISVNLSGKTIKEIYSANAWTVSNAKQIDAAEIADIKDDQSLLSADFALDDDDNIDYTKFMLAGVKSLSDIKVDHIVYVYQDRDKEIVKIEVGTETATGVVKNFKDTKSNIATKFAIGANTYKNAAEVLNGSADSGAIITDNEVSDEVKAFLDGRGYVYDFENATKADNYAIVKKVGGIDQAQLMLADGTTKTFEFDDSASKAGKLGSASIIGYGLNSSGVITDANRNWVKAKAITLSSVSVISDVESATRDAIFSNVSSAVVSDINKGGLKIASDCVVFTYDQAKGLTADLDVTTIDKVDVGAIISEAGVLLLFDENSDGSPKADKVVAMLIPSNMAKGGDKSYAVLNERNKDANDDGDKVWSIIGFKDGAKLNAMTDDQSSFGGWSNNPAYKLGIGIQNVQLFEVKVDADGTVTRGDMIVTGTGDQHRTSVFEVKSADTRKSVVAKATVAADSDTSDASGGSSGKSKGIQADVRYALAKNVVIYQVTDENEYRVYTGKLEAGDSVQLFETDDDEDGYDVVIMGRE